MFTLSHVTHDLHSTWTPTPTHASLAVTSPTYFQSKTVSMQVYYDLLHRRCQRLTYECAQEPAAKRQKTNTFQYNRFPPDIMLYKCDALPDDADKVERQDFRVGSDGSIEALDNVDCFYLDTVDADGKSALFNKDITKVAALSEEQPILVTP